MESVSPLYSQVLWGCFETFFDQYHNEFIISFGSVLGKLSVPILSENTTTKLVVAISANYSQEAGRIFAEILARTKNDTAIGDALEKIKAYLEQLQPKAIEIVKVLDCKRLDEYLKDCLGAISDYQSLAKRLKYVIDGGLKEIIAWQCVLDEKLGILIQSIKLDLKQYGGPPNPDNRSAKLIAQTVIKYAMQNDQNALLTDINNRSYYFKNLGDIKGDSIVTKYLKNLTKSGDQINSDNAKRILEIGDLNAKS